VEEKDGKLIGSNGNLNKGRRKDRKYCKENVSVRHVNNEECKFTVETQLYVKTIISYIFRLYIAIIRLNKI
jgi:hypothetical protein